MGIKTRDYLYIGAKGQGFAEVYQGTKYDKTKVEPQFEMRQGWRAEQCNYWIRQMYTEQGSLEAHLDLMGVYPDERTKDWNLAMFAEGGVQPMRKGRELWGRGDGNTMHANSLKSDL